VGLYQSNGEASSTTYSGGGNSTLNKVIHCRLWKVAFTACNQDVVVRAITDNSHASKAWQIMKEIVKAEKSGELPA
jgi:hypothetical protein